jgi:outer membrane biosynthesis protein TonB
MKARRLLLAAALAAAPAFAQQNVDISGKDYQSGAGDAKFAALGREAAASGKRVVVTAPQEWHAKIRAKIRAGGGADVVMKDGFYENVLVRVEDKPAEPPKVEPKVEAKAEPKAAPRAEPKPPVRAEAQRIPLDVPGPKPTLPAPEPEAVATAPPPAPAAAPPPAAAPAAPPVKTAPAVAVATPSPAAAPAKPDVAKIRERMEQSLNNGREAEGPLSPGGLQAGDFIFVDEPVRAVVRRESLRPRMFWLEGDLDLRRAELKELGTNRYQVIDPIRGDKYSLRDEKAEQSKELVAAVPADNAPGRAAFERDYNDGHAIGNTIAIEKLRSGDIVYAGKGMAVVVRREGQSLTRYWLDGTLDLGQSGLQKDGNKYKVISDTVH